MSAGTGRGGPGGRGAGGGGPDPGGGALPERIRAPGAPLTAPRCAGRWGILFSHPRDFTPVCTTELGRAARLAPEFSKRNVKMIALSIDSVPDHLAWSKVRRAPGPTESPRGAPEPPSVTRGCPKLREGGLYGDPRRLYGGTGQQASEASIGLQRVQLASRQGEENRGQKGALNINRQVRARKT